MELKYFIEFTEYIEDLRDITDYELTTIKCDIEHHLKKYISISGARIENFKLNFDLED